MRAIDRYVRELAERLPAAGGLRERVREEVTGHLSDAASDLERQGIPPAEAEQRAIAGFGSPDRVARGILEELDLQARAVAAVLARAVAAVLARAVAALLARAVGALPSFRPAREPA